MNEFVYLMLIQNLVSLKDLKQEWMIGIIFCYNYAIKSNITIDKRIEVPM